MSYFHALNNSGIGINSFNPGSFLSGYDWDIDPEVITGADGDPVIDAFDVSGAGLHYGQNTTLRQPTIKRAIYNGHDAIRFGTNKCLVPDPTARNFGSANTLICVCTPSAAAEYILAGSSSEGRPAFLSGFLAAFEYWNRSSSIGERSTFSPTATGLHILTLARTDDVGNYIGYYDGIEVFNVAVNTSRDWTVNSISVIGALTAGSSQYSGDIARIIHYSQNHAGAAGLTSLHAAIKARWGTP
jgi:hypothetical protein